MAVNREDRLVGVGDALDQLTNGVAVFVRHRIAHGIGDVDGAGTGVDHLLDDAAHEIQLGAAGIFQRELHVADQIARPLDRTHGVFHHLIRLHLQLVLHVDRRGRNKGMDTTGGGIFQRFTGTVDIGIQGSGQGADGALLDGIGNRFNRFEVTGAGDGKARFDHIHAQLFQLFGDAQLLILGHRRAGALLAVTQGGIKNNNAIVAAHAGYSFTAG